MTGCDDGLYRVRILMPLLYEVRAASEEDARRQGIDKWRRHEPAAAALFPEDVTVEEVVINGQ